MRSLPVALLALGMLTHTTVAQVSDESLRGTWQIISLQDGGRTAPDEVLADAQWNITDDMIVQKAGGETLELSYVADPSRTPKWIDFKAQGRTMLGIYELAGDTLTVCFAEGGGAERSTAFESRPASVNDVLIVLTRK